MDSEAIIGWTITGQTCPDLKDGPIHVQAKRTSFVTDRDVDVASTDEDGRFMEIMEKGIHKNKLGNWEMPLPFLSQNVSMPNNSGYAVKRFTGLLPTFKRKPQMEKDLLRGRLLPQQLVSMGKKKTAKAPLGWDDPLSEELLLGWQSWKNALPDLKNVSFISFRVSNVVICGYSFNMN